LETVRLKATTVKPIDINKLRQHQAIGNMRTMVGSVKDQVLIRSVPALA
jgi:hypothetical protein